MVSAAPVPVAKAKSAKSTKVKISSDPKKAKTHPPYMEMIKEAIVTLKERAGSSQYAIAKFIEENQKANLSPNFKKLLLVQLKRFVASGKLVKVKNSFKLSTAGKPASVTTAAKKERAVVKVPMKKKDSAKAKTGSVTKPKGATPLKKKKKVAPKPKAVLKPKKAAKTPMLTSPGKKTAVTPAVVKVKSTPAKAVKKPKSIRSPVKKAAAKKGKK